MQVENSDQYERAIAKRLAALPRKSANAFGALCAERIVAALGADHCERLRRSLQEAWELLDGSAPQKALRLADDLLAEVPDDDAADSIESLILGNAAAAVSYVLQSLGRGELEPIVWAARQAREAAEAVVNWNTLKDAPPDEAYLEISRSKEVQQELRRQLADLADLERGSTDKTIAALRSRAQSSPVFDAVARP